jgi:hypothetical protein
LVDAYKNVREAEKSGNPGDAARARADALSAEQGLIDEFSGSLADAATDALNWAVETGASADDAAAKFRENVDKIKGNLDELPPRAREVIGDVEEAIDEAEAELIVQVEESGLDGTVQRIEEYLAEVRRNANIQVFVTPSFASPQPSGGGSGGGGTTTAEEQGLPDDWQPSDGERSLRGMKRSKRSGDGGSTEMTVVVEMDGRELARAVERVSERDGGLRVKVRGGQ